ncbi:SPL family radical SAM protein [Fusobacterium varium]|uniref:SPL family radical SAM protein n=1 Tax=Fusobacterium varium TaxID=856 RepID=UPI0022E20B89|nr:radical SAM protein [Fusobacterium varium]MCF0170012.1 radical SAM protein [Fusobacterium varium]
MNELEKKLLSSSFSHIYIEKEAVNYPLAKRILEKFPNSNVIEVEIYKEIFSKGNQNFIIQKKSPKLILAVKKESYLYEGAKVCESFGNDNFYYTSSVMNCVYDCEYCYLQGVYTSANIVIFVNIEDCFREIEKILQEKSMYICISYDTDLLALEGITGLVEQWYEFVRKNRKLKIELRTKSSNIKVLKNLEPADNFILAWTLSPKEFTMQYEKGTAVLEQRLKAANEMLEKGWKVRVCFDPVIYMKNFEEEYGELIKKTFKELSPEKILDISIGTFRISKEYLKRMRKSRGNSEVLSYPFFCENGVYSYYPQHINKMMNFMRKEVKKYIEDEKIFI